MVEHKITLARAGVPRATGMTTGTIANTIDLGAFCSGEVASRSARWNRFAGERPRADADARELAGPYLRLLRLGFKRPDFPFGAFVEAGPRPPIWIELPNAGNRFVCPGLGNGQARRLPWLRLVESASAPARPGTSSAGVCILGTGFPITIRSCIRRNPT